MFTQSPYWPFESHNAQAVSLDLVEAFDRWHVSGRRGGLGSQGWVLDGELEYRGGDKVRILYIIIYIVYIYILCIYIYSMYIEYIYIYVYFIYNIYNIYSTYIVYIYIVYM